MKPKLALLVMLALLGAVALIFVGCKRGAQQASDGQKTLVITQDGKVTIVSTADLWRATVTLDERKARTNGPAAPAKR